MLYLLTKKRIKRSSKNKEEVTSQVPLINNTVAGILTNMFYEKPITEFQRVFEYSVARHRSL